jgi:Asp-tRNA(Asn)/Glu-tRNA(Gln) amidotransferase C subunit
VRLGAQQLSRLCDLAGLDPALLDLDRVASDLEAMHHWIDVVEASPLGEPGGEWTAPVGESPLREPSDRPGDGVEAALANAPQREGDHLRVPRIRAIPE